MVTGSTASPASLYTQSGADVIRSKNDRSKASEPAVKHEAPNSTPNQSSAMSPGPDPFTELNPQTELLTEPQSAPIPADSTDIITSITPNVLDYSTDASVVMGSESHSVTFSPIVSSSELPSTARRTLLQSVTPRPHEKINTHFITDRNPALALAKRSLDSRKQGVLTENSFSKLLQRWITETAGAGTNEKVKLLERETPPVEHVEQISPGHLRMDSYTIKSSPGNVFKILSREPDCKGELYLWIVKCFYRNARSLTLLILLRFQMCKRQRSEIQRWCKETL